MSAPSLALAKWLTRYLSDITEEGAIARFELFHKIEGEHAERLELWRNDADDARDPQELAQEIQDAADRDVLSRVSGQPQRYAVYAFRGETEEHESQLSFLVRPGLHQTRFGEDSEPPTEKGVIAHFMRQNENIHRLMIGSQQATVGQLSSDLERERAARQKSEDLHWNMFEKYQKLLDKEHERRIAEAKELMKARRLDEMLGVATALLPIIVTKVLGTMNQQPPAAAATLPAGQAALSSPAAGAPEYPADPKDAAIRVFFAGLSEIEISGVLGSLSGTNQLALAELHRAFADGANGPADVAARQITIRKFLKGLNEEELRGVFASLSDGNRAQLLALYAQYRDIEQAEQASKPEILRS
jgi:hypothetical protein